MVEKKKICSEIFDFKFVEVQIANRSRHFVSSSDLGRRFHRGRYASTGIHHRNRIVE